MCLRRPCPKATCTSSPRQQPPSLPSGPLRPTAEPCPQRPSRMQRTDHTNDRSGFPRKGGRQLRAQAAVDGVPNDEESQRPDAVEPAPDPSATTIWRSRSRGDIGLGSIDAIRTVLAGPLGIHDRRWRAAVGGDAAAAVAIAIRFLHHHDNGTAARDLGHEQPACPRPRRRSRRGRGSRARPRHPLPRSAGCRRTRHPVGSVGAPSRAGSNYGDGRETGTLTTCR